MLYTEETVKDNLRSREGKRVFFLGKEDRLTPGARDFLTRERVEILPAEQAKMEIFQLPNGAYLKEKPEHMTHLQGNILVPKDHPRIRFRGAMDTLEAEMMLCQLNLKELRKPLEELLGQARVLLRCEVLGEPVPEGKLCGLTPQELRAHSHRPQDYYGQPHFMPTVGDGAAIVWLNRLRCAVREAERLAVAAFRDGDGNCARPDIIRALNRMSSMVYILMIREKSGGSTIP